MTRSRLARQCAVVAAASAGLLLAGCAGTSAPGAVSPSVSASSASPAAVPERIVEVFLPPGATGADQPVPVVVLVPGGGWTSADPAGLVPLAESLVESGSAAVTTTYRTEGDGGTFPTPLEDVVCAVDEAVERITASGVTPGPVVVAGHSAGAQLAALAALVGEQYQDGCASPHVTVDGFVGLAGPYDMLAFADVATGLFDTTPAEDPGTWEAANPMAQAGARPDLPVLLLHGAADEGVSPMFSEDFSAALGSAGHPVTLVLLPDVDHTGIYQVDAAAAPIAEFVSSLTGR